jgi:hypothetical protein
LNADTTAAAQYTGCFGQDDWSSVLTQYFSGEYRLFGASTTYGTSGSYTPANTYTSYAGSHHHIGNSGHITADPYASNINHPYIAAGNHRHLLTYSAFTNNIYRTRMTFWRGNAEGWQLQPGMIFMYNNVTPPSGWALCDGTGGTPDLTDRFLEFGTTSNHGTSYGTGQVTANWSEGSHAAHKHQTTIQTNNSTTYSHVNNDYHPNGHGSSQVKSFTPPYYALAYIMYTG